MLCRDRGPLVAIEKAHSMSQQGFSVATGSWAIRAFGVATQFCCCDKGAELLGWSCVATQSLCRDSGAR